MALHQTSYTENPPAAEMPRAASRLPNGYWTPERIEAEVIAIAERECEPYELKGHARKRGPTIGRIGEINPKLFSAIANNGANLRAIYLKHGFDPHHNDNSQLADWEEFEPLIRPIVDAEYVHDGKVVKKAGEVPTLTQFSLLTDLGLLAGIEYQGYI